MNNKYIQQFIKEQFSISDMDFSDDEPEYNANIFSKNIVDPEKIYNNIISKGEAAETEINELDNYISAVSPSNINDLADIITFYSQKYPEKSLNWLDVSGITDMGTLFWNKRYDGDISKWDVSNVTNMCSMFAYSWFTHDISSWNVSNVTNMGEMFRWTTFNQDISQWDVSNVRDMSYMFCHSEFNQDISKWNVNKVIYYNDIFSNCNISPKYMPAKFRNI